MTWRDLPPLVGYSSPGRAIDRISEPTETLSADEQKHKWEYEESLRAAIRKMSNRSLLYRVLKEELSARGWWKNRARGKPGNPSSVIPEGSKR